MRKKTGPRLNPKREYETHLGAIRIARGLTLQALADMIGSSGSTIGRYQTGLACPCIMYGPRIGKPTRIALLLSLVLEVSLADLFPRYMCDIDRFAHQQDGWATPIDMADFVGEFTQRASDGIDGYKNILRMKVLIDDALTKIPRRLAFIIRRRFGLNGNSPETLESLAVVMGIKRERVRQLEAKGLRKLRDPFRRRKLKEYRYD